MTTESLFFTATPEKIRVKKENTNYDDLQTTLRKLVLQSHPFSQTFTHISHFLSFGAPEVFKEESGKGKSPLSSQVGSQAGQFLALKI